MHNRSPVILFISGIFILLSFLITPQVEAQTIGGSLASKEIGKIEWTPMETETKVAYNLAGVSGSSPTDVFAVGDKGVILHYDGDGNNDREKDCIWEVIPRRDRKQLTSENLNAVWVSAGKAVFIAGDKGTILFGYKGVHWSVMSSSTKANLYGIWGSSYEDVFIVGAEGTILHYDGGHDDVWEVMDTGIKNQLNGIWGDAPDNIFAVGNAGVILHYDGKQWTLIQDLPSSIKNCNLKAVWGSGHSVFAVGDAGTILQRKDKKWSPIESNTKDKLDGIVGFSPIDIFTIGESGDVLHYDGNKWSPVNFPAIEKNQSLRAIWVSANPHIYIIGNGGIIYGGQWSGAYWLDGYVKDITNGSGIQYAEIWVKGSNGYPPFPQQTTDQWGHFIQPIEFPASLQTLQFTATNYRDETDHTINLQFGSMIPIITYLRPKNAPDYIVGIVTKLCQVSANYYDCPVGGATVELYEYIDVGDPTKCIFSTTTYDSTQTDAEGHYSFSNIAPNLYKIKVAPTTYCSNELIDYVTMPDPKQLVIKDLQYAAGACQCPAGCPYPEE